MPFVQLFNMPFTYEIPHFLQCFSSDIYSHRSIACISSFSTRVLAECTRLSWREWLLSPLCWNEELHSLVVFLGLVGRNLKMQTGPFFTWKLYLTWSSWTLCHPSNRSDILEKASLIEHIHLWHWRQVDYHEGPDPCGTETMLQLGTSKTVHGATSAVIQRRRSL